MRSGGVVGACGAGSAAILAVAASKPTVTVDAGGRIGVERQMKVHPRVRMPLHLPTFVKQEQAAGHAHQLRRLHVSSARRPPCTPAIRSTSQEAVIALSSGSSSQGVMLRHSRRSKRCVAVDCR